jgi:hypothetical protein
VKRLAVGGFSDSEVGHQQCWALLVDLLYGLAEIRCLADHLDPALPVEQQP